MSATVLEYCILTDDPMTLDILYLNTLNEPVEENEFNIESFSEDDVVSLFRFNTEDLRRLKINLRIPDDLKISKIKKCSGFEGLCILLRRLAYPNRLFDLSKIFYRSEEDLSRIINHLTQYIRVLFQDKLINLDQTWLSEERLELFSRAIINKGSPLDKCWGFIDGTVRPMCRPGQHQEFVYNGHKRVHSLKYQTVLTPDGLIANLFGPIEGRRHDLFMLKESKLLPQLEEKKTIEGDQMYIFGDQGYTLRRTIIVPFRRRAPRNILDEEEVATIEREKEFNNFMRASRISVEWGYGKVIQYFAFLDFKKNLKLFLQPVGDLYKVATLFTNCHTCLYGSLTGDYFGVNPPTLEEYLDLPELEMNE